MNYWKKSVKSTIFFDMNPYHHYDCAPMVDEPLPKQVDPRKLATKQAHFTAQFDLLHLPRMAEAVVDGAGDVTVDLRFLIDEQRIRKIEGSITCETQVICQRCMEPMKLNLSPDVNLGIAWDEVEAQNFPKSIDPVIVGEDEQLDLNSVVEEELLLSFPYVSYHEPSECKGRQKYESSEDAEVPTEEKKENPFSVLEQLKSGK